MEDVVIFIKVAVGGTEVVRGNCEVETVPVDLEGGGGTTVGVDETTEMVPMIVVTTDDGKMMDGGIKIVEVVLITLLLLVVGNVIVATEGIVTRIVDIIDTVGELGCGVETIDVLVVVDMMLFVTLTKVLETSRDGNVVFSYIVETINEVTRLVDVFSCLGVDVVTVETLKELAEVP